MCIGLGRFRYFPLVLTAYAVSLLVAMEFAELYNSAQPALIYLIPGTVRRPCAARRPCPQQKCPASRPAPGLALHQARGQHLRARPAGRLPVPAGFLPPTAVQHVMRTRHTTTARPRWHTTRRGWRALILCAGVAPVCRVPAQARWAPPAWLPRRGATSRTCGTARGHSKRRTASPPPQRPLTPWRNGGFDGASRGCVGGTHLVPDVQGPSPGRQQRRSLGNLLLGKLEASRVGQAPCVT